MSNTFLEDIPEFLEIQRTSFLRILDTGLIKSLDKINPIAPTSNCNYGLFFYPKNYVLVLPDNTITEAFLQGKTYGCKIYVPALVYEVPSRVSKNKGKYFFKNLKKGVGKNVKSSSVLPNRTSLSGLLGKNTSHYAVTQHSSMAQPREAQANGLEKDNNNLLLKSLRPTFKYYNVASFSLVKRIKCYIPFTGKKKQSSHALIVAGEVRPVGDLAQHGFALALAYLRRPSKAEGDFAKPCSVGQGNSYKNLKIFTKKKPYGTKSTLLMQVSQNKKLKLCQVKKKLLDKSDPVVQKPLCNLKPVSAQNFAKGIFKPNLRFLLNQERFVENFPEKEVKPFKVKGWKRKNQKALAHQTQGLLVQAKGRAQPLHSVLHHQHTTKTNFDFSSPRSPLNWKTFYPTKKQKKGLANGTYFTKEHAFKIKYNFFLSKTSSVSLATTFNGLCCNLLKKTGTASYSAKVSRPYDSFIEKRGTDFHKRKLGQYSSNNGLLAKLPTRNFKKQHVGTNKAKGVSRKEWVCIGVLPLMTPRGHFIINGSHRIVVSQMARAPGIYYNTLASQDQLQATIVPSKGAWLRMSTKVNENGDIKMWVRITPQRKMPYKIFFETYKYVELLKTLRLKKYLGSGLGSLTENSTKGNESSLSTVQTTQWYKFLNVVYKKINKKIKHFDKHYAIGVISGQINRTLLNWSSYTLGSLGRKRINERLGINEQTGYITSKDIYLIKTNLLKLLYEGNSTLTGFEDDIDHLENRRVRTCGELLQSEIEVGMSRLKKTIGKQLDELFNQKNFTRKKGSNIFKSTFSDPNLREMVSLDLVQESSTQYTVSKNSHETVFVTNYKTLLEQKKSSIKLQKKYIFNKKNTARTLKKMRASVASVGRHDAAFTFARNTGLWKTKQDLAKAQKKYLLPSFRTKETFDKGLYRQTGAKSPLTWQTKSNNRQLLQIGDSTSSSKATLGLMTTLHKSKKLASVPYALALAFALLPKTSSSKVQNISQQIGLPVAGLSLANLLLAKSKAQGQKLTVNNYLRCPGESKDRPKTNKRSIGGQYSLSPSKIVGTKAFAGALREFFGSNPLSQYMDQTNPLAEITHKRRLSSLGPGGIDRASAGIAIRGIHPSHYGRICPIETPEGKNAGLVNSMTMWSRINKEGFLETPYLHVKWGSIMSHSSLVPKWNFITTKSESRGLLQRLKTGSTQVSLTKNLATDYNPTPMKIVASDLKMSASLFLPATPLPTRDGSERSFGRNNREQVDFFGVSPTQNISVATSLIPFLEHDDATRALMGSNMQRQAVPLLKPQGPLVRTGLEGKVVGESGHALQASSSGLISNSTRSFISIDRFDTVLKKGSHDTVLKLKSTPSLCLCGARKPQLQSCRGTTTQKTSWCLPALHGQHLLQLLQQQSKTNSVSSKILSMNKTRTKVRRYFNLLQWIRPTTLTGRVNVWEAREYTSFSIIRNYILSFIPTFQEKLCRDSLQIQRKRQIQALQPYSRSNQGTICVQRPAIKVGQWVQKGDLVGDCSASFNGVLSLGQNIVVAYLPMEGFNFEDAIVVSNRLVHEELYTSIHVQRVEFDMDASVKKHLPLKIKLKKHKSAYKTLQQDWITLKNPHLLTSEKEKLNSLGIIKVGSFVGPGDVLVSKVFPVERKIAPSRHLLLAVFQEKKTKTLDTDDTSLRVPKNIHGRVINVKIMGQGTVRPFQKAKSRSCLEVLNKNHSVSVLGFNNLQRKNKNPALIGANIFLRTNNFKPSVRHLIVSKSYKSKDKPCCQKLHHSSFLKHNLTTASADGFPKMKLEGQPSSTFKITKSELFYWKTTFKAKEYKKWANLWIKQQQKQALKMQTFHYSKQIDNVTPKLNKIILHGFKVVSLSCSSPGETTQHMIPLSPNSNTQWSVKKQFFPAKANGCLSEARATVDSNNFLKSAFGRGYDLHKQKASFLTLGNTEKFLQSHYQQKRMFKTFAGKGMSYKTEPTFSRLVTNKAVELTNSKPFLEEDYKIIQVRVYIAERKKLQVGDKMSGRHGNKGIVSTILPREDMPYLPDGTSVDMVLNPLGIPSRMNVGQVFECLLGLAASICGEVIGHTPFDEMYGPEASRSLVYLFLYFARLKTRSDWLFQPSFPGKTILFDGRSGTPFEQWVTVGRAYMLKLIHMVDEKIHARSIGPRSLVTQQPIKGRARGGGQRLGEMELWAFEGFGAAYTLQEILTVKADDIRGREEVENSIISARTARAHLPETFKMMLFELKCLCLNVDLKTYL